MKRFKHQYKHSKAVSGLFEKLCKANKNPFDPTAKNPCQKSPRNDLNGLSMVTLPQFLKIKLKQEPAYFPERIEF
jgi:hypothetical protein